MNNLYSQLVEEGAVCMVCHAPFVDYPHNACVAQMLEEATTELSLFDLLNAPLLVDQAAFADFWRSELASAVYGAGGAARFFSFGRLTDAQRTLDEIRGNVQFFVSDGLNVAPQFLVWRTVDSEILTLVYEILVVGAPAPYNAPRTLEGHVTTYGEESDHDRPYPPPL